MNQLSKSIIDTTIKINEQGKHHIFCSVYPHVNNIDIVIHENGWKSGQSGISEDFYYAGRFYDVEKIIKLKETLDQLLGATDELIPFSKAV